MITILWPCTGFVITDDWQDHMSRPGYGRAYAGTDLARTPCPLRGSQYGGKVLQAMMSTQGYGYTTLVEYAGDDGPVLRIRNAHQEYLGVKIGDKVDPGVNVGGLGTTGNSTGNHDHFEIWLKLADVWTNVDPLDPRFEIKMVYDPAELKPLGGGIVVPPPVFTPVEIPKMPVVKTSVTVTAFLNLREQPYVSARRVGQVNPGEEWKAFAVATDNYTNIWYGLARGNKIGWAAAYYGGETLLVEAK